MNKLSALIVVFGMIVAAFGQVRAADVVIGVPNWPSVNVTAHIFEDRTGRQPGP